MMTISVTPEGVLPMKSSLLSFGSVTKKGEVSAAAVAEAIAERAAAEEEEEEDEEGL
jgi:hypothetical protein